MLIPENLINITVTIRDIIEIWTILYFANYLSFEKGMSAGRLLITVVIVAGIVVTIDWLTVMPILPVLALIVETVILKLMSGENIAKVMGNLMFGILVTFVPELLVTWISMIFEVSENSFLYFFMTVGLLSLIVFIGIITGIKGNTSKIMEFAEAKRDYIVIFSVSAMIPLVLLGRYFLWDSLMFWEGYEGTATLVAVYFVIGLYLLKTFFEFTRNKSELEVSSAYSEYLSGVTDELNKREHEYKNQLNAIIGMAESGEENACEEIIDFAEEIIKENAERKRAGNVISDNSIVASYILKMSRVAEEKNISFDYRIERPFPKFNVSNREMLEIIANLINNAFEAVSEAREEDRNVSLCIEGRTIEVINYVGNSMDYDKLSKSFNTGYSTKGTGRGYGMSNILTIANKHNIAIDSYVRGDYLGIRLEMQ